MSTLYRIVMLLATQASLMYGFAFAFTDAAWLGAGCFFLAAAFAYFFVRSFTYSDNS